MTPAPTTSSWSCLKLIGVGVLAVVLVFGGLLALRPTTAPTRAVRYELSGTARSASITTTNADGGIEQRTVKVPYESSHRMARGAFASLSAQNEGDGVLTCTIVVEGEPFKTSTSEGQYKIASCSGAVP